MVGGAPEIVMFAKSTKPRAPCLISAGDGCQQDQICAGYEVPYHIAAISKELAGPLDSSIEGSWKFCDDA